MPLILLAVIAVFLIAKNASAGGSDSTQEDAVTTDDPFFKWDTLIKKYAASYSVPWRWIKAVMMNESSLGQNSSVAAGIANPSDVDGSTSSDGKSWGLMQLTIPTAAMFQSGIDAEGLNDPETSVRLGARYLAWLIDKKGVDDKEAVIRSYNGGPGYLKTVSGQRDTPVYYARFQRNLSSVMARQPGNELEY